MQNLIIKKEELKDQEAVYELIGKCFDTDDEVSLVRLLHNNNTSFVSLVAELEGRIVGQIVLSKMSVENVSDIGIYAIGPMCVLPELQHQGIGTRLVQIILNEAKAMGLDAVFVLGHDKYYPKFGFIPTEEYQIHCEYDVPAEVFMVYDISNRLERLKNKTVVYADEFKQIF